MLSEREIQKAKEAKEAIRKEIYVHIHSHNKVLNKAFLEGLHDRDLLAECHPADRDHYTKLLTNG